MTKTLVLIPTYNEKDNIPILIADLMTIPGVSVMVLDDQSPDGTGKVADELGVKYPGRVFALHRTGQRGLGRVVSRRLSPRDRERLRLRRARWTPTCRTIPSTCRQ